MRKVSEVNKFRNSLKEVLQAKEDKLQKKGVEGGFNNWPRYRSSRWGFITNLRL